MKTYILIPYSDNEQQQRRTEDYTVFPNFYNLLALMSLSEKLLRIHYIVINSVSQHTVLKLEESECMDGQSVRCSSASDISPACAVSVFCDLLAVRTA